MIDQCPFCHQPLVFDDVQQKICCPTYRGGAITSSPEECIGFMWFCQKGDNEYTFCSGPETWYALVILEFSKTIIKFYAHGEGTIYPLVPKVFVIEPNFNHAMQIIQQCHENLMFL